MPYTKKGECRNTGRTHFKKGHHSWNKNKKGVMPISWNKGTKGVMKANKTSFKKGCPAPKTAFKKGNIPFNYKGGKTVDGEGYILILQPTHPNAKKNRYVLRSHLIVEKYLGRFLKRGEIVHHVNEIRDDDRIENFIVFKNCGYHCVFHRYNRCNPKGIVFDGRLLNHKAVLK